MSEVRIGMVGYRFMGRVHSHAYRVLPMAFPEAPQPVLARLCGRRPAEVAEAARTLGWQSWTADWRELVSSDVDAVDVSAPGDLHHDVAIAALEAGKHVVCEKPLGNNLAEARAMRDAAARSGRVAMTIFNYRYLPAVQLARRLVTDGTLGRIYHFRAQFLQDWIADPDFPMVWRLRREQAGSGTLGDLAAHLIDMCRFLVGEVTAVAGDMETFIRERRTEGGGTEAVTVDDAAAFLARIEGGVQGVFEVTRFARGRRCANRFEINGSGGSVAFDFERLNELEVYLASDRADLQGFRTVNVLDPAHPYAGRWWPPGHGIGYETGFVHQLAEFLQAVESGQPVAPTFEDGYRCQQVLEAVELSARKRAWVDVADVT